MSPRSTRTNLTGHVSLADSGLVTHDDAAVGYVGRNFLRDRIRGTR